MEGKEKRQPVDRAHLDIAPNTVLPGARAVPGSQRMGQRRRRAKTPSWL